MMQVGSEGGQRYTRKRAYAPHASARAACRNPRFAHVGSELASGPAYMMQIGFRRRACINPASQPGRRHCCSCPICSCCLVSELASGSDQAIRRKWGSEGGHSTTFIPATNLPDRLQDPRFAHVAWQRALASEPARQYDANRVRRRVTSYVNSLKSTKIPFLESLDGRLVVLTYWIRTTSRPSRLSRNGILVVPQPLDSELASGHVKWRGRVTSYVNT